jgi:integrase
MRRLGWASATSIRGAGRYSCGAAGAAVGARSAWTPWGWEQLSPWLEARLELPVGPLFCIIDGPTRGRSWSSAGVRVEFRRLAAQAGVRRRFAPHQLRHAHAIELAREGVPLNIIRRQLGHANLGTTSIYLQGIDTEEIIATVHARRAPMMSATAGLQL